VVLEREVDDAVGRGGGLAQGAEVVQRSRPDPSSRGLQGLGRGVGAGEPGDLVAGRGQLGGVSPTTLVHHFGTKEQMLVAILGRLRERIRAATSDQAGQQPGMAAAARAAWARSSDPQQWPEFRLFFAVYGRALQAPEQFEGFLDRVVADWMSDLADAQGPGADQVTAARTATLVIATIRGLLLDLLATGDRDRVQDAAESFLATLERRFPAT
jgi:AcrR family transcriptional regulator